jgi:hypothetical protein
LCTSIKEQRQRANRSEEELTRKVSRYGVVRKHE